MRFVFFDIECANGGIGSICTFGYLITDEEFTEMESRDLIMNPPGKFKLTGRVGRPDVALAYSEETFRSAPMFPSFYEEIKNLLEAEDQIVVGHAAYNDAGFLRKSCERYGLPYLNFHFFDTQKLYRSFMKEKQSVGLDNALKNLGLPPAEVAHRSDEDAKSTMRLVRYFCDLTGSSLQDMVEKYPEAIGDSLRSSSASRKHSSEKDNYIEGYGKIRTLEPGKENWMLRGTKNHFEFIKFLDEVKPVRQVPQVLSGRTVSVSLNYEAYHYSEMRELVQRIVDAGGTYIKKASLANLFVTYETFWDDGSPRFCSKTKYVTEAIESGADIEMISFEELLDVLEITEEDLSLQSLSAETEASACSSDI